MQVQQLFLGRLLRLCAPFLVSLTLSACAVKMVADYDVAAFEEILAVGKKVDRFYGTLLDTDPVQRPYQKFSPAYVEIESDIRAVVMRNQARAHNEGSSQISQNILSLWLKYKDAHKANNHYDDSVARLDRDRFSRVFSSAAVAERAKLPDAAGKDAGKASE